MSAVAHPIMLGVNGWHRWSSWSAHFFVNGAQSCNTAHGNYMGGDFAPKRPTPADLAPNLMKCVEIDSTSDGDPKHADAVLRR